MHGPDRNLINPTQAVQQFNKNWGLVQDSLAHRDTSSLTYANLGISSIDEVAAVIVRKAKRANFNLVEMQPTNVSLLMSIPLQHIRRTSRCLFAWAGAHRLMVKV